MSDLISKELLSEVLEFEIDYFDIVGLSKDGKQLEIAFKLRGNENIQNIFVLNIHELAHKCKEWAREQSFILVSFQTLNSGYCCQIFELSPNENSENEEGYIKTYYDNFGKGNSIYQSCQYILDINDKGKK